MNQSMVILMWCQRSLLPATATRTDSVRKVAKQVRKHRGFSRNPPSQETALYILERHLVMPPGDMQHDRA